MNKPVLMLGNEAMAHGLVENGCKVAASYPGTPASEILSAVAQLQKKHDLPMHVQWSINEKVALETAYAAAQSGLRAAAAMKQVGLNVASDPFMSAAYLGVKGGFIVISADDPGPHSSQTEQDSRLLAMSAKAPVLDPDSPRHAAELIAKGYELSEAFGVPVMLRPTTRVCHANQDIVPREPDRAAPAAAFEKNPSRWAATPKFRYRLHVELNDKLKQMAAWEPTAPVRINPEVQARRAVVASGVTAAHAREILPELTGEPLAFFQVQQPYPLHTAFIEELFRDYVEILVLEETSPVIEMQLASRRRVRGRITGAVPEAGELLPETVERLLKEFQGVKEEKSIPAEAPGRRPTLCPGCPHRASFYAIKKAAPKGIYPSDIGCYTLGVNLGGVDTVLCMGAAISQAAGFHHAYRISGNPRDIVATIGDSTFYHAGVPPLVDAVVQKAGFVLVILDNSTTAMTGNQPTPATGIGAIGEPTAVVPLEGLVRGCGVGFCKVGTPSRLPEFTALIREALEWSREHGPAVIIGREPCVVNLRRLGVKGGEERAVIGDGCTGCRYCVNEFECPALVFNPEAGKVTVDSSICTGCGVCLHACPKKAISVEGGTK